MYKREFDKISKWQKPRRRTPELKSEKKTRLYQMPGATVTLLDWVGCDYAKNELMNRLLEYKYAKNKKSL